MKREPRSLSEGRRITRRTARVPWLVSEARACSRSGKPGCVHAHQLVELRSASASSTTRTNAVGPIVEVSAASSSGINTLCWISRTGSPVHSPCWTRAVATSDTARSHARAPCRGAPGPQKCFAQLLSVSSEAWRSIPIQAHSGSRAPDSSGSGSSRAALARDRSPLPSPSGFPTSTYSRRRRASKNEYSPKHNTPIATRPRITNP